MALKIRLRQQGRRNQIVYRLVLSDSRSPRDGKFIEVLGWYNPFAKEDKSLNVQAERISYWLSQGAILSEKAEMLVKRGAPSVLTAYQKKMMDARMKACKKRRETKKKRETAAV